MKNKLLFYGIGLCIGLYIAAAMFPSRLADINVAIPDGYIISIFGSKLYNVSMYLSIMLDLINDPGTKTTKLFFLKGRRGEKKDSPAGSDFGLRPSQGHK